MPDPVLWLLLGLVVVAAGITLAAGTEWLFGRERPADEPVVFEPIVLPPASDDLTQLLPVRFVGRASVTSPKGTSKEWVDLAEFARPVPTAPALIGSDVEALFTLRRLAVSAA